MYAVSCEVIELNSALKYHAEYVHSASFTGGWIIKIKLLYVAPTETLLDAKAYERVVGCHIAECY
ncbi:MAG: hypothetical protein WKF91_20495 [Segetibacter sp.]